jgi:hypothetical protein
MTTLTITNADTAAQARAIIQDAIQQAAAASQAVLARMGGRDSGCCGFAWTTVHGVRSNSRLGKVLAEFGFSPAYGGGLQLWNPGQSPVQNIDIKEAGAEVMATILQTQLGVRAYAGSRMD